ncbi:hypothetical protein [Adhaeribacter radiodurans]|uniref:Glycosyltransferase family 39 protein n=1 Tax=Adhaeribacter radiodurans TaxID=2745197 RepID=A0A7L7L3S0_9BACT|nr:hypothetical protein [Adhaeribacter radiodurans]QMU27462.1 hypothetical protein HUW48_05155 [Adhaeribacter radiodurans]
MLSQIKFNNFTTKVNVKVNPTLLENGITTRDFWSKWIIYLLIIFIIFSFTIVKSPNFWVDEHMNVDLGRIILQPDTRWAISWMTKQMQPVYLFSYLGIVFQEIIYQKTGHFGPGIFALIGAFFAATIMVKWLLAIGTSHKVALFLSLVFLLDPLFVQSYTLGRLDGWTIASCLFVCLLLRNTSNNLHLEKFFCEIRIALAGGMTVVSIFIWPSAFFLYPLILLEFIYLLSLVKSRTKSWNKVALPILIFGLGSLIAFFFLIIPIYSKLLTQISDVISTIQINLRDENIKADKPFYMRFFESAIGFLKIFKYSPVLPLIAFIGIIRIKKVGLFVAGLTAALIMICTLVYPNRVLYLIPYFIIGTAYLFHVRHTRSIDYKSFLFSSLQAYVLVFLLIWSITLSIGARTILSLEKVKDQEIDQLYRVGESMLGKGNYNVFAPYELYYIGRSLGWRMYYPYVAWGENKLSPKEIDRLLPLIDFAIIGEENLTKNLVNQLKENGMYDLGYYQLYKKPLPRLPFDGITTNTIRLRNLYKIYKQPFGPYKLFARESKK